MTATSSRRPAWFRRWGWHTCAAWMPWRMSMCRCRPTMERIRAGRCLRWWRAWSPAPTASTTWHCCGTAPCPRCSTTRTPPRRWAHSCESSPSELDAVATRFLQGLAERTPLIGGPEVGGRVLLDLDAPPSTDIDRVRPSQAPPEVSRRK
ncbi:hypothetical protein OPAG_06846 [Rhodococcus opacus PD630]|nr:hypothetical protein OPAG_06846 [Rhodococcus opacus PD630]